MTRAEQSRGAVLITGASSGIGRATALALDAHGFRVFAGVRKPSDVDVLHQVASARLTPLVLEVTNAASIAAAAEQIAQAVGDAGLIGLVNNAGVTVAGPLEYLALVDVRRQFEINVVGPLALIQACLPLIRQAHGRIVNISSVGGKLAMPFNGAYSATKFGVEALSDALRRELAPWGIHVCIVEPGLIATPMGDKLVHDTTTSTQRWPAVAHQRYGAAFQSCICMMAEHARGQFAHACRRRDHACPVCAAPAHAVRRRGQRSAHDHFGSSAARSAARSHADVVFWPAAYGEPA